jgi:PAS domain S-box-containing protein
MAIGSRKRTSAPRARQGRSTDPVSEPEHEAVNILLVDDQPGRLSALEAALADMGEDVQLVKASSGKEALRQILKREFAIVLLDVHMPVMDGFETASLIRQRKQNEKTPIIFITAYGPNEAHVTRGYSLGAVDYIFAPVMAEVLKAKVTVFLDLHRKTVQVKRQADWLREEAERRADAIETRLRGLLDRIEVGVFRATPEGRLVEANPAFLELMGLKSMARALELNVAHLLAPSDATADGTPGRSHQRPRDLELAGPDGRTRWLAVSVSPARTPAGEEIFDGIIEDVTDRKRAEQELRRAHDALEVQAGALSRSNADLQRFAHVISHDLQEPLRMVATFTDVLDRRYADRLDAEAHEYLRYAREGAERMQKMIHGLLDFCLLEKTAGKFRRTDCNEILDRVLANLAVAVEESGAGVSRDRLPVVEADDLLLSNVFQNLVANGLKFRREGVSPKVHVGAERRDGAWTLSVRDNGIGIDPKDGDRLFMVFRRLPGSESYPGTGVGLAICKRIVERHGGRIWWEPAEGGGSVFLFTIPDRDGGELPSLRRPTKAKEKRTKEKRR